MKLNSKQSICAFITAFTVLTGGSLFASTAGEKLDKGIEKVEKAGKDVKDKAKELAHDGKEKVKELHERAKDKASELHDKAKDKARDGLEKA